MCKSIALGNFRCLNRSIRTNCTIILAKMQRKEEILAKKAKLAELRRQREERERRQKEISERGSATEKPEVSRLHWLRKCELI